MPIYCYKCPGCGERMEVFHKKLDYSAQRCPECGTAMEKIIGPVGIIFKGSGFYCTDNKKNGRTPLKEKNADEKKEEKSESTTDGETKATEEKKVEKAEKTEKTAKKTESKAEKKESKEVA